MSTKQHNAQTDRSLTTVREHVLATKRRRRSFTVRQLLDTMPCAVTVHAVRRICREMKGAGELQLARTEAGRREVYAGRGAARKSAKR